MTRHARTAGASVALAFALGCGAGAPGAGVAAAPQPGAAQRDTASLIPAGKGSLRQDEISIKLPLTNVEAQLIPTDESVIRLLSPDSYRTIRNIAADRAPEMERHARVYRLRERNIWMVTFIGLAPGARFTPNDLTITQSGREFRPLETVGITRGFGEGRLQPGERQLGLYLFEDGLELSQPLTVRMGNERSTAWDSILRVIERERTVIRSRGG